MEQEQSIVEKFEKFIWKIENFSRLKTDEVYSETFVIGGYPWKIRLHPKGDEDDEYLQIYVEAVKTANMSEGWSRVVKFKLLVFNQLNTNMTISEDFGDCVFDASETSWGFYDFMELDDLNDPQMGFIVEDACIVGAEIFVSTSSREKLVNQADSLTVSAVSIEPTKQDDAESGYAALGRVIHFFKTRKVKDMNEQVCKELQVLWDELKKFQFDVTWLELHVQSALGMKSYVEKVLEAEKLKQNMTVLELEMERLKEKLVAAELNIDVERDSLNAKGFKEIGLDSELGCVIWRPQI
ncbi:MATH domain and coiled-coil domain-containing protein At3g58410-like [Trifolium pratense]|uniref:MATH domain and coiled-coil domain-containing protein At3g58410-like n=1 Tax=Trifolium pratense TaxID=57577 RepID=UPI001E695B18|nr:MATH domain and coiled-coil domain-containing protein At3g58410-like [Trifolium pratense]